MMRRLPDWQERLAEYYQTVNDQPFVWGRSDCLTFVGGAVQAMTGQDLWSRYLGRYEGRDGVMQVLSEAGHADMVAAAEHVLIASGLVRVEPDASRTGDVVVVRAEPGQSFALRDGAGYVVRHEGGLAFLKVKPIAAWSFDDDQYGV